MAPGGITSPFHGPSHPPSRRTTAPSYITNDLVQEVLLRLPPSDPAALVRASLVCKEWMTIVSNPTFELRYRDRQGPDALVGFISNSKNSYFTSVRFDAVSPTSIPRRLELHGWRALDARHGRILLCGGAARLAIWDLYTGERREVASLPPLDSSASRWNAAVLCAEPACDHSHCYRGPYYVVVAREDHGTMTLVVHLYASSASMWTSRDVGWLPWHGVDDIPPACVKRMVWVCTEFGTRLVGYQVDSAETLLLDSPIKATEEQVCRNSIYSTRNEKLGLACLVHSKLKVRTWEWQDAEKMWEPSFYVDLESMLLLSEFSYGLAVLGVILVGAADGIYEVHGGIVRKRTHCSNLVGFFPFINAGGPQCFLLDMPSAW